MSLFERRSEILISCANRLSPYLKEEVESLGYNVLRFLPTAVIVEGTLKDCIKLNMFLKTAHKVAFLLKRFKCKNADELYQNVIEVDWENIFPVRSYFSIVSAVSNLTITDTRFPSLKCKDAIADRFMNKFKERPDSGPDKHKIVLFLHWEGLEAAVFIDTSGETIARHGYRKLPGKAPLQESLACGILYASKWDKKSLFINPMCGSGTLVIEAALMALNKPPGIFRSNFCFMHLNDYQDAYWEEVRKEAKEVSLRKTDARFIATDIEKRAIDAARKNAATAGVDHMIEFKVCDFRDTPVPEGEGIVLLNPEYGERLGEVEELEVIYKEIGDFFKKNCKGKTGYVFTGNLDLAKKIGLKTSRRVEFYNGKFDCRLLEFELYEGTKRGSSNKEIRNSNNISNE
ncbi:MAG: class I SAM-dependent RNA methyltransferase [Cytophagaceae bacterium]